jgi:Putative adhesin
MRQVNRLLWSASGVVTAVMLAIPGTRLLTRAAVTESTPGISAAPTATLPAAPAGLTVYGCGANVRILAERVSQIQVAEQGQYAKGQGITPSVTWSLAGRQVMVGDQGCTSQFSPVGYTVAVPMGTPVTVNSGSGSVHIVGTAMATVDSEGGNVSVNGTPGANVDSGSGFVNATDIDGPLTVDSEGGNVSISELTGTLNTNTGSGELSARDLDATDANATTEGGNAAMMFADSPQAVNLITSGGDAVVDVPDGPYALTASTSGGSWSVEIATNPQARKTLTITTNGGNLVVAP